MTSGSVTVFLSGDVMLGRGVDQVLEHPGDPVLHEAYVHDAREYVRLAERVSGPVPYPVDVTWPWGDVLPLLEEVAPHVRVVNLETSVTTSGRFARGKAVHYRMSPADIGALSAVRPDVCVLANNHVLDFGPDGLLETLDVLERHGIPTVGAGRDVEQARRAVAVPVDSGRVLVSAFGTPSSGVPATWAAGARSPGVAYLGDLSDAAADDVAGTALRGAAGGDLTVVSLHWGSNWGYRIHPDQVRFAHRLVDAGVSVVHGHSSHHPRPVEVYRGRLVLYGCGDLVNDYEGIGGYERYRDDLRLVHLATLDGRTGELVELRMVPVQARRLRLHRASRADGTWLRDVLHRESSRMGTPVTQDGDGALVVRRE